MKAAFEEHPHFYVLNDRIPLAKDMQGRTYFITHAERNWKQLLNLVEAFRILRCERPTVLISTGASPIVPFAIVGRLFFRTKVIFIETITRVKEPSVTARIMYRLAHRFYYQHPELERFFPRGRYLGTVV